MKKTFDKGSSIVLLLIISFYLFWELRDIRLPGLQKGEAWIARFSFGIIKNQTPIINSYYSGPILGRRFPLLSAPYHGVCDAYLVAPFIFLCGLNIVSLRIFQISIGLFAILFLFLFCKKFLNKLVALIVVFLLAIDWAFIAGTKIGLSYGSMLDIFLIGSLLCFYEWYKTERKILFLIGNFLIGLGVCVRTWFLWYLIALSIIFGGSLKIIRKKFSRKDILICLTMGILTFSIASGSLIYHELKSNFGFISYLMEHFCGTHDGGFNNLQYFRHLSYRISNFIEIPTFFFESRIDGLYNNTDKFIMGKVNWFYFYAFSTCLVWHSLTVIFKKGCFLAQKRFLLFLFLIIFFQTPVTMSRLKHHHLLMLLPITKILLGIFLYELMNFAKWIKIMVISILIVFFAAHLYGLERYNCLLEKTGGVGEESSDAIHRVVDYFISKDIKSLILMRGQIPFRIYVLSGGRIKEKHFNFLEWPDLVSINIGVEQLEMELENEENIFLFCSDYDNNVQYYDLLLELVQKKNKNIMEYKRFYRRDGKLMFTAYRIY